MIGRVGVPFRRALDSDAGRRLAVVSLLGVGAVTGCGPGDERVERVDGERAFVTSCAVCHGAEAVGTARGPSLLSVVYEPGHHPDEAFRSAARNGVTQHHWEFGDMPPVGGLDDTELEAIISYVRGLQEKNGFTPAPQRPGASG